MAKDNAIKLNLPSADDLFSTQESRDDAQREKVMDIPLSPPHLNTRIVAI